MNLLSLIGRDSALFSSDRPYTSVQLPLVIETTIQKVKPARAREKQTLVVLLVLAYTAFSNAAD